MLVYFLFPFKKQKWTVLLVESYVFYLFALWINRIGVKSKETLKLNKQTWDRDKKKKFKNSIKHRKRLVMALVLLVNFGILAFLKYYNFFAGSLNDVMGMFGIGFSAPTLKLFLPLGLSF